VKTIGGDRIVGLLAKIDSPFRPITQQGNTTMRQLDVGAELQLADSLALNRWRIRSH